MRSTPLPITEPAIMAVRSVAPLLLVAALMTVGITVADVKVDEPETVTKDEVMNDVVWPPFVGVGVVEVGLFWRIGDGDDDEVVAVVVVPEIWVEDNADEVVEVGG